MKARVSPAMQLAQQGLQVQAAFTFTPAHNTHEGLIFPPQEHLKHSLHTMQLQEELLITVQDRVTFVNHAMRI